MLLAAFDLRSSRVALASACGGIAVTFLLAEISWRMVERPALRLKRFVEYSSRDDTAKEAALAVAD